MNLTISKILNKQQIFKLILTNGPMSRLALHNTTGLSKMTISNLVTEYLEKGIMYTCDDEPNVPFSVPSGRKTKLISIVPNSLLTLGINIEQTFIQVGIINLEGSVLLSNSTHLSNKETSESFLRKITTLASSIVEGYRNRLWGIGISAIGPKDIEQGKLIRLPGACFFPNVDIVTPLREIYGLPVYFENDVNASALAEMYFGFGKQLSDFLYVSIKDGIGSGIIIDRKLYTGQYGYAGELGHVLVEYNGKKCICGNCGCLEQYASIPAILEWHAHENGLPVNTDEAAWATLVDGAYRGDESCKKALQRMCSYLSSAFISAVNILDFQRIFLGGNIGSAAELLLPNLNETITQKRFAPIGDVQAACSKFPKNSSFIGTAALVIDGNCSLIESDDVCMPEYL